MAPLSLYRKYGIDNMRDLVDDLINLSSYKDNTIKVAVVMHKGFFIKIKTSSKVFIDFMSLYPDSLVGVFDWVIPADELERELTESFYLFAGKS